MCDKTEVQSEASATHGLSSAESAAHERVVMLPCPFCGGDAEIKRMGTNRVSMIIGCVDCSCTLETGETSINERSQWNSRAT